MNRRTQIFFGLVWLVAGALSVAVYWESFVTWLRIAAMSRAEVEQTPYVPIWTSARAVIGIVFAIVGAGALIRAWRTR
jgi:hypothetical protein